MTVTELIAALQGYPPDAVVAIKIYDTYGDSLTHGAVEVGTADSHWDPVAYERVQAPTVVIA